MSDQSQGPGWWLASDGKWYPPETHPSIAAPAPPEATLATELAPTEPSLPARAWRRYRGWPVWGQIVTALVLLAVVTAPFTSTDDAKQVSSSEDTSPETTTRKTTTTTEKPTTTTEAPATTTTEAPTTTAAPTTTTTAAPAMSPSQAQAVGAAEDYLAFSHFSRQGLIDQLSSEYGDQFSVADATFAVDLVSPDWNEQAAGSAGDYLELSSFSCQGLIDQLSSEYGDQYTLEQARYGANSVGIC